MFNNKLKERVDRLEDSIDLKAASEHHHPELENAISGIESRMPHGHPEMMKYLEDKIQVITEALANHAAEVDRAMENKADTNHLENAIKILMRRITAVEQVADDVNTLILEVRKMRSDVSTLEKAMELLTATKAKKVQTKKEKEPVAPPPPPVRKKKR